MLLSHRTITPSGRGIALGLYRILGQGFLIRNARLSGLIQDERFTKPTLGVDSNEIRAQLAILLDGDSIDFVGSKAHELAPGDAVLVPQGLARESRWSGSSLEIEWFPGTFGERIPTTATTFRAGKATTRAARALCEGMRMAVTSLAVRPLMRALFEALQSDGLDVDPKSVDSLPSSTEADQTLMREVDRALSNLHDIPMLVDLETSTGQSRRSLTRNIRALHERHALLGRGGGKWRAIRDTHRLVVASILASNPTFQASDIASMVGYGSVEALDHAFLNVGLPSPTALGRALRAA